MTVWGRVWHGVWGRVWHGVAALACVIAAPLAAMAQGGSTPDGDWYGGYSASLPGGLLGVEIDMTQFAGSPTGLATITFTAVPGARLCPPSAHPALCDEMHARALRALTDRRALEAQVTGVVLDRDRAVVVFSFADERRNRVLELRERTSGGAKLTLYHPERGADLHADALPRPHLCQITRCATNPQDELLRRNPFAFLGTAADLALMRDYPFRRDGIAEAHRKRPVWQPRPPPGEPGAGPDPAPGVRPDPAPRPDPDEAALQAMKGNWSLRDETGRRIGLLALTHRDGQVVGRAVIHDRPGLPALAILRISERDSTAQAVDLRLRVQNHSGGSKIGGRLILTRPQGKGPMRGTYLRLDHWELVSLHPEGPYEPRVIPDPDPASTGGDDIADEAPADSGVTGSRYRLADLAPGTRNVALHAARAISSVVVGEVSADARGLRVIDCAPRIDAARFDAARPKARREMLARGWCKVTGKGVGGGQVTGWIDGRFLQPMGAK
jgi:hypothetical protein